MTSSKTVAVIDYGMGNLRSVSQAVQHVAQGNGFNVVVTSKPEDVMNAERIVLPGQGAISDCMRELAESGLLESVLHAANNKPLFGVCVGMQMLLTHSEEGRPGDGGVGTQGLGLVPGNVVKFDLAGKTQPDGSRYKVPQMGWNQVSQSTAGAFKPHPIWQGVPDNSYFYFVHSFYVVPSDARHTAGTTGFGQPFTSAIARDNIFATQFHPEKSADQGLALYRNFLSWNP